MTKSIEQIALEEYNKEFPPDVPLMSDIEARLGQIGRNILAAYLAERGEAVSDKRIEEIALEEACKAYDIIKTVSYDEAFHWKPERVFNINFARAILAESKCPTLVGHSPDCELNEPASFGSMGNRCTCDLRPATDAKDAERYREARNNPGGFAHLLNLMVRENAKGEALDKMMDRIIESRASAAMKGTK